jgi:hypothetical protein
MTGTTERPRRLRPTTGTVVDPPLIREVCLVGSPGRRYVHLARDKARDMDRVSRKEARVIGTG